MHLTPTVRAVPSTRPTLPSPAFGSNFRITSSPALAAFVASRVARSFVASRHDFSRFPSRFGSPFLSTSPYGSRFLSPFTNNPYGLYGNSYGMYGNSYGLYGNPYGMYPYEPDMTEAGATAEPYGALTTAPQEQSSTTPRFVPVSTSPTAITAVFEVRLPDTFGSVAFNDMPVQGVGSTRYYVSPALPPGKIYTGTVTATWKRLGGHVVSETREVAAQAGHTTKVDFTHPAEKGAASPAYTDRPK